MNVKDIIEGMADRAFKFSFLQGINDLYDSRDYGDTEPDYQTGFNHLMMSYSSLMVVLRDTAPSE